MLVGAQKEYGMSMRSGHQLCKLENCKTKDIHLPRYPTAPVDCGLLLRISQHGLAWHGCSPWGQRTQHTQLKWSEKYICSANQQLSVQQTDSFQLLIMQEDKLDNMALRETFSKHAHDELTKQAQSNYLSGDPP